MKYLQDYLSVPQSAAFKKYGAFFAFSGKQFTEAKVEGVEYNNMGAGLICPKVNCEILSTELDTIWDSAIKQDVAEHGISAIIRRELYNHEAFYTYSIESTMDALEPYRVKHSQVWAVFNEVVAKEELEEN
jgi:hypothetical protein